MVLFSFQERQEGTEDFSFGEHDQEVRQLQERYANIDIFSKQIQKIANHVVQGRRQDKLRRNKLLKTVSLNRKIPLSQFSVLILRGQ